MSKKIYFGLAQWRHPQWYLGQLHEPSLTAYARSFSSVEGNSSFYALPSKDNLTSWQKMVPDDFRFCFKFPKEISHQLHLSHCSRQVGEFLNRISILNDKLGVIWLQVDQFSGAQHLSKIMHFMSQLPESFTYGIEVRHLDYFSKGDVEKRFNQFLITNEINRIIFDTRSLFALERRLQQGELNSQDVDNATQEAFAAKPKVPTHVIATAKYPFVRIIIPNNRVLGEMVILQWVEKIHQWLVEGLTPYVFFHTPDNIEAPQFAVKFSQLLKERGCDIDAISLWQGVGEQDSLF